MFRVAEKGMPMIVWIIASLLVIGYGQDVTFNYESCSSVGSNVTMTAVYTGSGIVLAVQWYYSGTSGSNLAVAVATCSPFGSIPTGYPNSSRMSYECPATDSLAPNTFKLTVTELQADELNNRWGATFTVSGLSPPAVADSTVSMCSNNTDKEDKEGTSSALELELFQIIQLYCGGVFTSLYIFGIVTGCILSKVANKWWNKLFNGTNRILLAIFSIIVVGLGFLTVHLFLRLKATKVQPELKSRHLEKGLTREDRNVSKKEKTKSSEASMCDSAAWPCCCFKEKSDSAVSWTDVELQESSNRFNTRDESNSVVSRAYVELQESSNNLAKRQNPGIPQARVQGHDNRRRGVSTSQSSHYVFPGNGIRLGN